MCVVSVAENGSGLQGDDCEFLNGCAKGFGCVLINGDATGSECAKFCDVEQSYPATCEIDAGAGFRCVRSTDFYSNAVTIGISFCVGPEWFP